MKIVSLLVGIYLFISLTGCKEEDRILYMTNLKAATYFEKVETAFNNGAEDLWGANFYGPILLVNPDTREVFSNVQDAKNILKPRDGIFVGSYPKDLIINFIDQIEFGSTQFALVRLRGQEDEYQIVTTCIHSLFHVFQKENNIYTPDYQASHLSERTARLYVKLEWRALRRAIRTSGDVRTQALRDALVFRSARREMYPSFAVEENHFENYEGLTTFTYLRIYNQDTHEYIRELLNYYDFIYSSPSYPGSWAFSNGALYSHLLYEAGFDFTTLKDPTFDLGEIASQLYEISLPEISRDIAGSLAFNYDIDLITKEEQKREASLRERLRKRVSKFIDRPVVFLELESPNFNFEPDDMDPVDTLGVIYNSLRVTDNWGKISVDNGGCLVSPNLDFIRVPAKNISSERNHISGDGWHIILNESWEMVELDDNYIIRKLIP